MKAQENRAEERQREKFINRQLNKHALRAANLVHYYISQLEPTDIHPDIMNVHPYYRQEIFERVIHQMEASV